MTRVNVGVNPANLSRQHLLAEHREIIRIPNAVFTGRLLPIGIPDKFCFGRGHVKFFYDKLNYLHRRYCELYDECVRRGYDVTPFHDCFIESWGDYDPVPADLELTRARLLERGWTLQQEKVYHI